MSIDPKKTLNDLDSGVVAERVTVRKLMELEAEMQAAQITLEGNSPLPLTDEQIIGVLHSCGIDTYPSVNGFASLQASATSIPWIREVVRRCMVIIEAADSRVTGNAQAALSDDQIKFIAQEVGMLVSHDGKYMRSVGTHGGMNVEDGIAFARAILATRQPAPVASPEFSRDPDGDLCLDWSVGDKSISVSVSKAGVVSWAVDGASGAEFVAPVAAAAQGDVARYQRLRVLGVAPFDTPQLRDGTVLRFQNLDAFVDDDIAQHPSRGEANPPADSATVDAGRESQTIAILRKSLAGWEEECQVLRRDRDQMRQDIDLRALHQKNDVWYWQGDGTDYPESISNSMAVVIRGDQLRAILRQPSFVQGDALCQKDGNGADIDAIFHKAWLRMYGEKNGGAQYTYINRDCWKDGHQQGHSTGIESAKKAVATQYCGNGGPPDDPHPDAVAHNGTVYDCIAAIRAISK